MMKILYNTTVANDYTVKYYLTVETESDLSYYGIMITSDKKDTSFSAQISGIFPYEHNAMKLLMYLYNHSVTPLSMKDAVMEYMDEKFMVV
ncbi:MAG: hypothetical protein IJ300_07160 [Clostridia bacterium]|nr:hypothetical protein [Clostridia bacterium]